MRKQFKEQELYLKNMREAFELGIRSRFTAYLMYRCEMLAIAQEREEKGRAYNRKDLIKAY